MKNLKLFFIKINFIVIIVSCCDAFGEQDNNLKLKENVTIISLGESCFPATMLRNFKIRDVAYPFDWMITPFMGLYKTLSNNFANFLNEANLIKDPFNSKFVVDKESGVKFAHDFPHHYQHGSEIYYVNQNFDDTYWGIGSIIPNFKEALPDIKNKYNRRIERFFSISKLPNHIIFIRSVASEWYHNEVKNVDLYKNNLSLKQQSIMLRNLLKKMFPMLNFSLIFTANVDEVKKPWNINLIKNFYVPTENGDPNSEYCLRWKQILFELALVQY